MGDKQQVYIHCIFFLVPNIFQNFLMDSIYLHYGKYRKPRVMLCIYKKGYKIFQHLDTLSLVPGNFSIRIFFIFEKNKLSQILNSINHIKMNL